MRSKAGHGGSCPRCQTHDTAQRSCRTRERCSPRAMRRARRPAPARRACGRVSLARLRDGQLGAQRGVHAIAGHGEVGSRGALLAVGRAVRHAGDHLALAPLPPAWRRAASFGFFFFFKRGSPVVSAHVCNICRGGHGTTTPGPSRQPAPGSRLTAGAARCPGAARRRARPQPPGAGAARSGRCGTSGPRRRPRSPRWGTRPWPRRRF